MIHMGRKKCTGLSGGFKNIFSKKKLDDDVLSEFEDLLISADTGVDVAKELRKDFENFKIDKKLDNHQEILKLIADKMAINLLKYEKDLSLMGNANSSVIVVSGVNGVGKTTTIGTPIKTSMSKKTYSKEKKEIWRDPEVISPAFLHLGLQNKNGINNKYINAWDLSKKLKNKYIIK